MSIQIDEPQEQPIVQDGSLDGFILDDMEQIAVSQALGLNGPREYSDYEEDVRILLKYAKTQTEDRSLEGLKWVIRKMGSDLGSPPFNEDRIKYLKNYALLVLQERKIKEQQEKYKRKI